MMKRICVYCGSSFGAKPEYAEAAKSIAAELAQRNIELVYGGAHVGLMGLLADTMMEHGGRVTGVMPQSLVDYEVAHTGLSEFIVVDSMHERKAKMASLADGFIALPGGLGTLEELFEMLTWSQLGFHDKPCAALNINGYYEKLAEFLAHTSSEGFVRKEHVDMLIIEDNCSKVIDRMLAHEPGLASKWLKERE